MPSVEELSVVPRPARPARGKVMTDVEVLAGFPSCLPLPVVEGARADGRCFGRGRVRGRARGRGGGGHGAAETRAKRGRHRVTEPLSCANDASNF